MKQNSLSKSLSIWIVLRDKDNNRKNRITFNEYMQWK